MIIPLLLAVLTSSPASQVPERLALVIANNHSLDDGVAALHYADDDGARLYELLQALGYDTQLLTIMDRGTAEQHPDAARAARPPSWSRLERTVRDLRGRVETVHGLGREAEILITYSGHGAVGRRGDPYVNLLDKRMYRGDFYRDVVASIGADFVHVVVDACRARDFVDARGGPDGPDFDRELSLFLAEERRAQHPEVGIFVAESADGETHEWSRTRSGIFGHEVISGLSGAADVNSDGFVEYSELHAFVAAANSTIKDPRARLRVVAQPPMVNPRRPIMVLAKSANVERIRTPMAGGRFTIEDSRGVRWVDANLADGTQVTVHLPPRERYYIVDVERRQEATVEHSAEPRIVVLAALGFEPLATSSRGSISEALASDLFTMKWGPLFYEGFTVGKRYPSVYRSVGTPLLAPAGPRLRIKKHRKPAPPPAPPPESGALGPPSDTTVAAAVRTVEAERPLAATTEAPRVSGWSVMRWSTAAVSVSTMVSGIVLAALALEKDGEAGEMLSASARWSPGAGFDGSESQIQTVEAVRAGRTSARYATASEVLLGIGITTGAAWALSWLVGD